MLYPQTTKSFFNKLAYKSLFMGAGFFLASTWQANSQDVCVLDGNCWTGSNCVQLVFNNGRTSYFFVSIGGCTQPNVQKFITQHGFALCSNNGEVNIYSGSGPCTTQSSQKKK